MLQERNNVLIRNVPATECQVLLIPVFCLYFSKIYFRAVFYSYWFLFALNLLVGAVYAAFVGSDSNCGIVTLKITRSGIEWASDT